MGNDNDVDGGGRGVGGGGGYFGGEKLSIDRRLGYSLTMKKTMAKPAQMM